VGASCIIGVEKRNFTFILFGIGGLDTYPPMLVFVALTVGKLVIIIIIIADLGHLMVVRAAVIDFVFTIALTACWAFRRKATRVKLQTCHHLKVYHNAHDHEGDHFFVRDTSESIELLRNRYLLKPKVPRFKRIIHNGNVFVIHHRCSVIPVFTSWS
jgi:hypothetical protein